MKHILGGYCVFVPVFSGPALLPFYLLSDAAPRSEAGGVALRLGATSWWGWCGGMV